MAAPQVGAKPKQQITTTSNSLKAPQGRQSARQTKSLSEAHVGAAVAVARAGQSSMRSMPPNATHRPMTSMINTQPQPVHATPAVVSSSSANASTGQAANTTTITTSANPAGSGPGKQTVPPLNQKQQSGQIGGGGGGGQRTALKLSSRAPAPAQQQASQQQQPQWHQTSIQANAVRQQQPQQPQQQRHQQPQQSNYIPESPSLMTSTGTVGGPQQQQQHCSNSVALECSAISGLMTSNEHADLEPNDDDPSDCSCSNSLECSLDDPSHSTSSHLEQPLLGGPMPPPPLQIHHHQPLMANHHHQHYPPQAHQHPPHPHHNHHHHHPTATQPHHGHHRHQDIYNQHQQQNFHPPQQQPPYHKQQQQHYHQNRPQPQIYNQQSMQHRPLLPHASMPPALPSVARAYVVPSPPPLVRHSTYAATSDTITDDSLVPHHHSQQQQRHHSYMHAAYPVTPPSSPSAPNHRPPERPLMHPSNHQYEPSGNEFNETDLLITGGGGGIGSKRVSGAPTQKQGVNFKRSATTREGGGNKWRNASRPQTYSQSDGNASSNQHNTLPLERSHNLTHHNGASNSLQRSNHQRTSRASNNNNNEATTSLSNGGATQRRHKQPQHGNNNSNFHYNDNSQQQQQSNVDAPQSNLVGGRPQSSLSALGGHSQISMGAVGSNLLFSANSGSAGVLPHSVSPFEAAAAFCPPILAPQPLPLPPIGPLAISSHRTNSPWMRLSSIILTPVGILIVLFIVVSPLLHYLM